MNFFLFLTLVFTASTALAENTSAKLGFPTQYSGIQILSHAGMQNEARVYVDNGKTRMETDMGGKKAVLIVRPDLHLVYNIMPDQKVVMASPIRPEDEKLIHQYDQNAKKELITAEILTGEEHDKYKITSEGGEVFIWVSRKNGFPNKMQSVDGSLNVVWKDVKLGAVDASLFDPPKGYKILQTSQAVPVEKP